METERVGAGVVARMEVAVAEVVVVVVVVVVVGMGVGKDYWLDVPW